MDPLTGIALGSTILQGAKNLFGSRPNPNAINARYMGMDPQGYITQPEQGLLDRERARGTEDVEATGARAAGGVQQRFAARGMPGSVAEEQALGGVNAETEGGRVNVARNIADTAANFWKNNQEFARRKLFAGWSNELDQARYQQGKDDMSSAAWFNEMGNLLPSLVHHSTLPMDSLGKLQSPNGIDVGERGVASEGPLQPRGTGSEIQPTGLGMGAGSGTYGAWQ